MPLASLSNALNNASPSVAMTAPPMDRVGWMSAMCASVERILGSDSALMDVDLMPICQAFAHRDEYAGYLAILKEKCVPGERFKDSLKRKVCARAIIFLESGDYDRWSC